MPEAPGNIEELTGERHSFSATFIVKGAMGELGLKTAYILHTWSLGSLRFCTG